MIARKEITSSIVLILLGAGYLVYNRQYPMDSMASPGPAVFPLMAGGLFVLFAVIHLIRSLAKPADTKAEEAFAEGGGKSKALLLVAIFTAYVILIKVLGFFVSNFLFVVVTSRIMGARDWVRPLVLSAGVDICCYILFGVWLKMSLPKGLLF